MRQTSEISWKDMQDALDTSQAYLMAWIMDEPATRQVIVDNFIQPAVEAGDADKIIYAMTTIAASTIGALCMYYDADVIEVLTLINQVRESLKE